MRRIITTVLLASFVLGTIGVAGFATAQSSTYESLRQGTRSEEVEVLQEILAEDVSIYPEGLRTGYYGNLTKNAVKRLQIKYKVPVTGIVDEETEKVIFPYLAVKITSPNGGEKWDRSQLQTISWKIKNLIDEDKIFWPKASIDLYKRGTCPDEIVCYPRSVFVKHVAFVNLFDESYSWKISRDIPNGDDYVVRISSGRRILPCFSPDTSEGKAICLKNISVPVPLSETSVEVPRKISIPPTRFVADESDGVFAITGNISVPPTPSPDVKEVINTLKKISRNLEMMIKELMAAIEKLERML